MFSAKIITLFKDVLKYFVYRNLETDYWPDNWNMMGFILLWKKETFAHIINEKIIVR